MFSTVLAVRLTDHGVALAVIGFFAWVQLLPTFKFLWAPLLDRYDVPGFARFWGKRRGWIMLSQLGILTALLAMTFSSADTSLALTALFAVLLAFWTTTLEVAADAWRIELGPTVLGSIAGKDVRLLAVFHTRRHPAFPQVPTAAEQGWPDSAVHFEYFKNTNKIDDSSSFEVALARSCVTLQVPAGKTILQVMRESGIDVPSSCEQGACGTCVATVIEGEPDHQDVYLNDAERKAGTKIMTCVSRARSARLVLDI